MAYIQKIFFILLFIFPICIAFVRGHKNLIPIALLNILLGYTIIGYVIALAWSFSDNIKERRFNVKDWHLAIIFTILLAINMLFISIIIKKNIGTNSDFTYFMQSIIFSNVL